jgi:hypothetical protein
MKKLIAFWIFIVALSMSYGDLAISREVAISGENEYLIYENEHGVCQYGNAVFITYYRINLEEDLNYQLMLAISNSGAEFSESMVTEFCLPAQTLPSEGKNHYLPSIWADQSGTLHLFYLDLITLEPMVAVSTDLGLTFEFHIIAGLPPRSHFQLAETSAGLKIGTLYGSDKISISYFQHLSYYEESENVESYDPEDTTHDIKFWGPDQLEGPVYSADDIMIQQAGGGPNSGWPSFQSLVATSGRILNFHNGLPAVDTAPMDDIFYGGYMEEACSFILPAQAIAVRENGIILEESANHDVLMAIIDGNIAHLRYADRITQTQNFTVYNSFPDPLRPDLAIGDSIWTNVIDVTELVWQEETTELEVNDTSVFVYCDLWIEGSIGSNMTWASADTVYITADICYSDINAGDPAEDSEYLFGLISEERIYIKYKYRDFQGNIQDSNCNSIFLYGSYAALGSGNIDIYGDMNTHYEGIISFEYQHGHGSTPAFTIETPQGDWFVPYPDLHKFVFPPDPLFSGDQGFQFHGNAPITSNPFNTCGYPYENPNYGDQITTPYGADYPWYNPVYPEAANVQMGERGIFHLYGGKQERRRGYTHRSGIDSNNHSQDNCWDLQNWQYSGTHGSSGYDKISHWDTRLESAAPPDYPELTILAGNHPAFLKNNKLAIFDYDPATYSASQSESFELDFDANLIDFCLDNNRIALLVNNDNLAYNMDHIVCKTDGDWEIIQISESFPALTEIKFYGNDYIIKSGRDLYRINPDGYVQMTPDLNQYSGFTDFQQQHGGILHFINGTYPLWQYNVLEVASLNLLGSYDYAYYNDVIPMGGTLEIRENSDDVLFVQILKMMQERRFVTDYIHFCNGDISDLFSDYSDDEITITPSLQTYPNPFNPQVNLAFNVDSGGKVVIDIYNIRGQFIQTLVSDVFEPGRYFVTWYAPKSPSGVYIAQYKLADKLISRNKITLIK